MRENKIRLSVIIPLYQAEKTMDACIESVLPYAGEDMEILLISDGSGDGTDDKMRMWQEKDRRIRPFRISHQGVSAARNKGIQEARGEYVCFLDADDVWVENLPALLRPYIGEETAQKPDLLFFGYRILTPEGREEKCFSLKEGKHEDKRALLLALLEDEAVRGYSCNKCFRRDLGLYFDEKVSFMEDLLYCVSAVLRSSSVQYVSGSPYAYRKSENSVTMHPYSEARLTALQAYERIRETLPASLWDIMGRCSARFCHFTISLRYRAYLQGKLDEATDKRTKRALMLMKEDRREAIRGKVGAPPYVSRKGEAGLFLLAGLSIRSMRLFAFFARCFR